MEAVGSVNSKGYFKLEGQLQALYEKGESARQKLIELEQSGRAFRPAVGTAEYDTLIQKLGESNNQMSLLTRKAEEFSGTSKLVSINLGQAFDSASKAALK